MIQIPRQWSNLLVNGIDFETVFKLLVNGIDFEKVFKLVS